MVLKTIEDDLKAFKVDFDNWYYESSLGSLQDSDSKISSAIDKLKTRRISLRRKGCNMAKYRKSW